MELTRNKRKRKLDRPKITVSKGEIGFTDTYKCLGDQYDKTGRNLSKIRKKMSKSNYIAAEVKRQGRYENVGKADTSVRLLLLETMVKQTLVFNTETWVNVTQEELKAIDKEHYMVLRKVFEQKQNTPYFGILIETGFWPYSIVVIYKRLMYFHHLLHSDERRTAKKLVENQMEGKAKGKSWYEEGVEPWLDKLGMKEMEADIYNVKKSEWKKKVKDELNKHVAKEMEQHREKMTKLRFTQEFGRQNYVTECTMSKVKKIMKLKLNMTELKANFKGKYRDTMCSACGKETETTEHVIACNEYRRLTGHTLKVPDDWTEKMNDPTWVEEACEVYEQIEEVRSWIL